jgi:hypothetical protein
LKDALADTPVILLTGARQTGKTTLARDLAFAPDTFPGRYATLDDLEVRSAARSDPAGFLQALAVSGEPVILDEIQHVPELLPAIHEGSFVDFLFSEAPLPTLPRRTEPMDRSDLIGRVLAGGFPEAVTRQGNRRETWFSSYVTTILQRDVRDLTNIGGLSQMPRLLGLLSSRSATLLNLADLSRTVPLPDTTLQRYMALLEAIYLIRLLPAWSTNIGTRLLKTPKILLTDTGLSAHLMGISEERVLDDPTLPGGLLENFVALELMMDAS